MSTLCFSDIHGQKGLFDQIMAKTKPDDKIFFLGDAIDRGPAGWEILKQLINDPRVSYIKGNHEDMMCNAMSDWPDQSYLSDDMFIWNLNGNDPTIDAMLEDDPEVVAYTLKRVAKLPTFIEYKNPDGNIFWLSHAGFNYMPDPSKEDDYELIWNRTHYYYQCKIPENIFIVHGHTPIEYLVESLANYNDKPIPSYGLGAYYYNNNHKIDIDCGAHYTGRTVVLNLDTFEEEIFTL